jgi:type VI secretion system protein ImpL
VFAFPQEMAALREPLADFVGHVFGSTRFEKRVLLRGVYLTSATQHGTTFDRLAGALAEHLSLPEAAMAPGAGTGKAYFIERLLKDVILAESGIAGTNFRFELRKAAAQVGVYAAIIAIAAVTVGGLLWSYKRNSDFIAEVAAEAAPVGQTPAPAVGAIETQLPRLAAIRRVVDTSSRYADDVPFGMRWGLYQGRSLTATANDAYGADLHGALLPWLFARFERRLNDYGAQSELLYGYLKGYLMLTRESAHQNVEHLTGLAAQEFYQVLPPDDAAALTNHAEALFKRKPVVASYDETLVARARGSITNASIPRLVYDEVRASYGEQPGVRVDLAGAGFDRMFSRKGDQPITAPVPGVFTPDVFFDAVDRGIDDAAARFAKDQWVWG